MTYRERDHSGLLIGHTRPLDDELFTSWLARLAAQNGMRSSTFMLNALGVKRPQDLDLDEDLPEHLAERLSDRCGIPIDRVRQCTLGSYEGLMFRGKASTWVMPLGIAYRSRPRYGLQFCPDCLSEQVPYFRRSWRLAWCVMCATHNRPLQDRCECESAIGPIISTCAKLGGDPLLHVCRSCGFDLRGIRGNPYDLTLTATMLSLQRLCEAAIRDRSLIIEGELVSSLAFFDGLRMLANCFLLGSCGAESRFSNATEFGGLVPALFSGRETATERVSVEKRAYVLACVEREVRSWSISVVHQRNSPTAGGFATELGQRRWISKVKSRLEKLERDAEARIMRRHSRAEREDRSIRATSYPAQTVHQLELLDFEKSER